MPDTIEFFFDVASPYSYLAATRIDALAAGCGVPVRWRPFLLGGVFKAVGNEMPARVAHKARWMLQDLDRWARQYRVAFRFPATFPISSLRPGRALVAAERLHGEPAMKRLAQALFSAYWTEDRDVSQEPELRAAARAAGLDDGALLAACDEPATKDGLRAATEEAIARGAFGAPAIFWGDQLFWGNDRLAHLEEVVAGRL